MASQVGPQNVVGRDRLIEKIWADLRKPSAQGSLRFTAERRTGKTTVMTKMAAEPPEDFDVLFLEVEGIDSCDRFNELLINRMGPFLSKTEGAKAGFANLWKSLGGTELGGLIKLPEKSPLGWQATIEKVIEEFCGNRPDRKILLMLDELPYMLQKINEVSLRAGTAHDAITLLDTLRALRQRHPSLRMIFSGSVGLHHVLQELKQSRLASEPVNNMPLVEIPPLDDADALKLIEHLLKTAKVHLKGDSQGIAKCLSELSGNIPFYLERIIDKLAFLERPITTDDVDQTVSDQLASDLDPWEMEHFRSRLAIYYRGKVADANGREIPEDQIARSIIDHIAVSETPQSIDEVWSIVRGQFAFTDRQIVVQLLKSLTQDHYLSCDSNKRYCFRFALLKRWWKTAQGLES